MEQGGHETGVVAAINVIKHKVDLCFFSFLFNLVGHIHINYSCSFHSLVYTILAKD